MSLLVRCPRVALLGALLATIMGPVSGVAQAAARPHIYVPRATRAAISAADLRTRLYIVADDSMQGRQVRTAGNVKATAYLARELARMKLEPAGENGTYFQVVPYEIATLDSTSILVAGATTLTPYVDFVALSFPTSARSLDGIEMVFGGRMSDTTAMLSAAQARGKLVLLVRDGWLLPRERFQAAAAVAYIEPKGLRAEFITWMKHPNATVAMPASPGPAAPLPLTFSAAAAERLFGVSLDSISPGTSGGLLRGTLRFIHTPATDRPPARNVVAILRGTDRSLNQTYVAVGAHTDHEGVTSRCVDHDSLRTAGLEWQRRLRSAALDSALGGHQHQASGSVERPIVVNLDSLRRLRPARCDSIYNGADDDGSGVVAALEIAEALARRHLTPKRSVLFVFHTGEEVGLHGSRYFAAQPTVPRDSIITQINLDMIGRGSREDTPEGGPTMLMVVGASRLSSELGKTIEEVNVAKRHHLRLDYSWDAPNHPEGIYQRSDHYSYAQYGIPVAFFFTGLHVDYHQVTDEPQYVDYQHLARITRYLADLVRALGSRPTRPAIDQASGR